MRLKRFLLFAYNQFEEQGGMEDFIGDFDIGEAAKMRQEEMNRAGVKDSGHIYDCEVRKIVAYYKHKEWHTHDCS
jgi:hypothetical protein